MLVTISLKKGFSMVTFRHSLKGRENGWWCDASLQRQDFMNLDTSIGGYRANSRHPLIHAGVKNS